MVGTQVPDHAKRCHSRPCTIGHANPIQRTFVLMFRSVHNMPDEESETHPPSWGPGLSHSTSYVASSHGLLGALRSLTGGE